MDEETEGRQAELQRIEVAVREMAEMMHGRFELDKYKVAAFTSCCPDDGVG